MRHISFSYRDVLFEADDYDKGSIILFLHGFLENKTMWQFIVPELPKSYRKICLDLPGHGASGNLSYLHSMEDMAEVIKALLTHIKAKRVILCGHSMGGYVALAFAEKYPDMVKGLILMNSTAQADSEERKKGRNQAIGLAKQNLSTYIRMAIPMLFRSKNRRIYQEAIRRVKKEALKTSLQGVIAALEGMKHRPDREHVLHFRQFPILVIASNCDPVIPIAKLKEQIDNSGIESVVLENGHMSHIEDFEPLVSALKKFVRKVVLNAKH